MQVISQITPTHDCCMKAAAMAVKSFHMEEMQFLELRIADQVIRDQLFSAAAVFAARKGHLEVVALLVQNIADARLKEKCCIGAVESATSERHSDVVMLLLQSIEDTVLREQIGHKTLQSAVTSGYFDLVAALLHNISDQSIKDRCCVDLLETAASGENWEVAKSLVQIIGDQDVRDQWCLRLTESAARRESWELAQFLLQAVSNQGIRDQGCMKLAEVAASQGNLDCVSSMVQGIANETVRYQYSAKAAESAALLGHFEVVTALVQAIGDSSLKDRCYTELAESAAKNGKLEVVKFCVQNISDQNVKCKCCSKVAKYAEVLTDIEMTQFIVTSMVGESSLKDPCYTELAESAAKNGKLDVVMFCVQNISDQNVKDQCCAKLAEYAAFLSDINVTKFLVMSIADQAAKDGCCLKVVDSAAKLGRSKVVTSFLKIMVDQELRDVCCSQSVESAAKNNHLDVCKSLVQSIVDEGRRAQCCKKAAISAASKGHLEVVKFLVDAILDQNVKDECCMLAVRSAAENEHIEAVKFLLQGIYDQDIRDRCCLSLIDLATLSRKDKVIEAIVIQPQWLFQKPLLLKFLSDNVVKDNNRGRKKAMGLDKTPPPGHPQCGVLPRTLQDLLQRMQPDQITHLLCLSISAGYVALALTLLPHTVVAEVDLPDNTGSTALMLAADSGQNELVVKLLDLGASVRVEDSQGRTALSRACQKGHVRAAVSLIDRGAHVNHCDRLGLTCMQLAKKFGHTSVMHLLQPATQGPSSLSGVAHSASQMSEIANVDRDRKLSAELHHLLNLAGFTRLRAQCQQTMANLLQGIARTLTKEERQMTGSFAEGWANSLVQMNGRTAADSDIDWTVIDDGQMLHLVDGCEGKRSECKGATKLDVVEGHAQVQVGLGSQPADTVEACGVRPAQDTCVALQCCSFYGKNPLAKRNGRIHLVRAIRPNAMKELRLGHGFHEKELMRKLTGVQGQLFTILKFIFKRYLPYSLRTPGLKTYHAKTLLLFMLSKSTSDWKPQNLIALLKESLDMMLRFIDHSSSTPDWSMPHFFMSDAAIYFKNAGIGGAFKDTRERVRDRLREVRLDPGRVIEQLMKYMRPLQSDKFYFHPFTLLPLTPPPPQVTEVREGSDWRNHYDHYGDVYCVVHQCLTELQSELFERDTLMRQLTLLQPLLWCKCATLCINVMALLRFGDMAKADTLMRDLVRHSAQNGWSPNGCSNKKYDKQFGHWYWDCPTDTDWAWRFCFPCITKPHFPFLPEFTQTLLTARLSQPRSSHLYVNFRCLSWSLQAELLRNHAAAVSAWRLELEEDPDLEELFTLARYSDCREHLQFCLRCMETIRDEGRVAMETQDEEKIEWVRNKLQSLLEAAVESVTESDNGSASMETDLRTGEDSNGASAMRSPEAALPGQSSRRKTPHQEVSLPSPHAIKRAREGKKSNGEFHA